MKKNHYLSLALTISIVSCDKKAEVKRSKTAYVDTSELMKEYTEVKDLEAKYKSFKAQERRSSIRS